MDCPWGTCYKQTASWTVLGEHVTNRQNHGLSLGNMLQTDSIMDCPWGTCYKHSHKVVYLQNEVTYIPTLLTYILTLWCPVSVGVKVPSARLPLHVK